MVWDDTLAEKEVTEIAPHNWRNSHAFSVYKAHVVNIRSQRQQSFKPSATNAHVV